MSSGTRDADRGTNQRDSGNLGEWLEEIGRALRQIKHGRIELSIFDGRIVELQKVEKIRKD